MKEFTYVITDPLGIHARPAGQLVKEAGKFSSLCTLTKGNKTEKLTRLMGIMLLAVKHGDVVTVRADGEDEDMAIRTLQVFFQENL